MTTQEQPVGVHVGAGGDPLVLGLPVFAVASLALGMGLMGKPAGLGIVAPLIILTTGLFQLVATGWAIALGQSMVATIFGLFSGLWLTLGFVIIGTQHAWFGLPAGGVVAAEQLIFISYASLFFFLIIPCLRLPLIYPVIVILIVATLALAAAGIDAIAGYIALTFSFLGFWAWLNTAQTAMGAKRSWPPLGKVLCAGKSE
ncbi:MAG: GPR1/FUN34/YaaH family transporter [Steroidobacteraceae bacterium]